MRFNLFFLLTAALFTNLQAQPPALQDYNIEWDRQSENASESMPCGGGDIGLNVWVEGDELLFYIARSGTFDENNGLMKLGRIRMKLSPNPFTEADFKQVLDLEKGNVKISAKNKAVAAELLVWVDVYDPIVHVEVKSSKPTTITAGYESWRYIDRVSKGSANNANSYKWAGKNVITKKDEIGFDHDVVLFYHRNDGATVFDATVEEQGLESVKSELFDPLQKLTFGGKMVGTNMVPAGTYTGTYQHTDYKGWKIESKSPAREHIVSTYLHTKQADEVSEWKKELEKVHKNQPDRNTAYRKTTDWWKTYWERSYIILQPQANEEASVWQAGRNYQLFRYMLGCNAFGTYPTKFNGGLFTYDPVFVNPEMKYTPDHRNWGGGTFTAQNQRLVYFPMLKSGDFDLMESQFNFYLRALKNAELRSRFYWGHDGASFTEQLENFGLPNYAEYGTDRPDWYDKGMQYNAWLEYQWDTVLEFCLMILETERYAEKDISRYIPLIESSLTFFDEHYQYLAQLRGRKKFNGNEDLILYPGSSCETYKMAYNATPTVAGLQQILTRLLELPNQYLNAKQREKWSTMLERIPPISFQEFEGKKAIAPAKLWERINNTEVPQLYPVFPWGIYGVGKPDLEIALNTWHYDPDALKFRSHIGWKQDNIFAARLGLTEEAAKYTVLKLKDSGRRFPAFWGPGFDWVPDHNWGGSGMIGLQEMLLQTNGKEIYVFPAWPNEWDVKFKLHAPYNTIVEGEVKNGKVHSLKVTPEERQKDVVNMF